MADLSRLIDVISDYAQTITGDYDIGDVLYRLTDQIVEVLGLDGAGVSLGDADGSLQFISATDDRVVRIEQQQISSGEGPCHDAYITGQLVTSPDLEVEDRWPAYRPVALDQGCAAVAGIPMTANDQGIGAVNLYMQRPRQWEETDLKVAQALANMATGYIKGVRLRSAAESLSRHLQHALDSRVVIEQAKGILAERFKQPPHEVFDQLRHHARTNRTSIHAVARGIVEGTLDL